MKKIRQLLLPSPFGRGAGGEVNMSKDKEVDFENRLYLIYHN
jgi:hypothetical protein